MENDFVARRKLLVLLFATTIKMTAAGKLEFIKNVISDKVVSIDGVIDNLAQYYPIDDPEAHREYTRALDVTNKTVFEHGAVAAGGRVVDDSQSPAQTILADAAGNKVCVCAWPDGAEGVTVEE